MPKLTFIIPCLFLLCFAGCENVDLLLATDAGVEAVKAVTLSEEAVREMAKKSSASADSLQSVAPPENAYAKRLKRLVGDHPREGGLDFNYQVYLDKEVNAFAMADGTIRLYSGLMDMLADDELRFVIGHEMGHVALKHIHKQLRLAYASSAARKAIASVDGAAGEIARSQLGGFVQLLTGAQFSQLEEKEADDYGLTFLKEKGYAPEAAVSALNKLAALGNGHSFLSSHPDPGARAKRLALQLAGKAAGLEEQKQGLLRKSKQLLSLVQARLHSIVQWLRSFL